MQFFLALPPDGGRKDLLMYNIKLYNYVPEPQPAAADRIVAAHYYAAWKKGAAQIHEGFDDLHDFPERTPLMGYYDEENPEVCDWEIKWAAEHGVNCFIHCWYRMKHNEGKPVTVNDLRCGHGLHEALFNAKYQKYMKFAIMYENQRRWGSTDPQDLLENLLPFWTEQYFKRENYLKIDNKPVLFVFYPHALNEALGTPEEQSAIFDKCREYMKSQGFDGFIIAYCNTMYRYNKALKHADVHAENTARGYDFCFEYCNPYEAPAEFPAEEDIIEGQLQGFREHIAIDPMRHMPTVTCFRDATPRYSERWQALGFKFFNEKRWYLYPDGFRALIHETKKIADTLPEGSWGRKILMIDNWNEWDEGHYVSPSHEFGFRYLQAIREELTARDNLPDYRMPQDLGLSENLNKSWGEPDLGPICKQKLEEKGNV